MADQQATASTTAGGSVEDTAAESSHKSSAGRERKGSRFNKKKAGWRNSVFQQSVVKEGYLQKKSSGMVKQWQRRYFELSGHYLKYYEKKEGTKSDDALKGTIDVRDINQVAVEKDGVILIGTSAGSKIKLKHLSNTTESAAAWVDAIEGARTMAAEGGRGEDEGGGGGVGTGGGGHGEKTEHERAGEGDDAEAEERMRAAAEKMAAEKALVLKDAISTHNEARKEAQKREAEEKAWRQKFGKTARGDVDVLIEMRDKHFKGNAFIDSKWAEITEGCDDLRQLPSYEGWSGKACGGSILIDKSTGRVTRLFLSYKALEGDLPACIGRLDALEVLYLNGNQLTGDLPPNMGTEGCLPKLRNLNVNDNKALGGEICAELMSSGAELRFFTSGRRIRTPFLVATSLPSESITVLFFSAGENDGRAFYGMTSDERMQPKVAATDVSADQCEVFGDDFKPFPEHRCIREQIGSLTADGKTQCWPHWFHPTKGRLDEKTGTWTPMTLDEYEEQNLCVECVKNPKHVPKGGKYAPWQRIWMYGLYTVADKAKAEGEIADFFVVCHASPYRRSLSIKGVFKKKFMAADLTDEQQALKHRFDDFDAEYGLGGGKARSILDWERRAINMVAKEYGEEVVRIRYINEKGHDKDAEDEDDFDRSPGYEMDADGKPDWYADF